MFSSRFSPLTLIAIALFMTTLLTSCNKEAPNNVPKKNEASSEIVPEKAEIRTKRIVCFGNSLTAAYQLDPAQGWPALIQKRIDDLKKPYEVINAGISGETTADGLRRIDWILQQDIDIFILELGANDMLRGLTTKETRANLLAIMDKVREKHPDAPILLAEMKAAPNLGQDYVQAFESIYSDLPRERDNVYVIPFFLEGVVPNPDLTLPDLMHPNAKGYKIVADHVWKVLEGVLVDGPTF